jgi:arginyl-tRNA synthetase
LYRDLEQLLTQRILQFLSSRYPGVTLPRVVIEQPPKVELGDFAIPVFPFAKPLRTAPLKIAEAIRAEIGTIEGIAEMQVAPPGYLNVKIDRSRMAAALAADDKRRAEIAAGKILVEHTSINPNKAAHIGHLRNAILGDTFVRLLRRAGREVDVQNYIDNTGVQVADVVVGFTQIEKKSLAEIESLTLQPRFDYYCWDLYARVSQWYEQDPQNKQVRLQTLHAIEDATSETTVIADLIATAVLRRHLETMDRLDIEYDFLPRESEILHLHFWNLAREKLIEAGVITEEIWGKNKGCWVMPRPGKVSLELTDTETKEAEKIELDERDLEVQRYIYEGRDSIRLTYIPAKTVAIVPFEGDLASSLEKAKSSLKRNLYERQKLKVIIRSNGTVGYVGKDIAYHMWKFGLLGRDFAYRRFHYYQLDEKGHFQPGGRWCWVSTTPDDTAADPRHPHFGDVAEIYNVIDARQSEAQSTVIEALRGLGHNEAADHYTHFSYEMVALTPRCAEELGYTLKEEDKARSYIEVSGRKGFGVKADDLIDQLIASAKKEVDSRHPQLTEPERVSIATQIATGALRYFMLKFTKQSVIAFDFKEALSFEGETGPYAQYAVVRATSIFKKADLDPDTFGRDIATRLSNADLAQFLTGEPGNEIWELWLAASKTSYIIDQCISTTEPAYLAKHAFQLAQLFNAFYHRHPILSEADGKRKQFLLGTVAVVRRELIRTLEVMGITVPPVM